MLFGSNVRTYRSRSLFISISESLFLFVAAPLYARVLSQSCDFRKNKTKLNYLSPWTGERVREWTVVIVCWLCTWKTYGKLSRDSINRVSNPSQGGNKLRPIDDGGAKRKKKWAEHRNNFVHSQIHLRHKLIHKSTLYLCLTIPHTVFFHPFRVSKPADV